MKAAPCWRGCVLCWTLVHRRLEQLCAAAQQPVAAPGAARDHDTLHSLLAASSPGSAMQNCCTPMRETLQEGSIGQCQELLHFAVARQLCPPGSVR